MNLYTLSHQLEQINAQIEADGGEISPLVEAELERLASHAGTKADDFAAWIRSLKAAAEMEKAEAAHFTCRKQAHANLADRLAQMLLRVMKALGTEKLKGRFTLTDRLATTPRIRWVGPGEIPDAYRKVTVELDGQKALEDYRAGRLPAQGFAVDFSHWLDIR